APKVYDEYRKAKRPWKVIHENQA
ncbi:transcriptional regulator, partial [Shigella sonnei]|nr:transcriptional regulator [Shigella sonnei]